MGDTLLLDIITDGLNAISAAQEVVALDHLHLAFLLCKLLHAWKIEHLAQAATCAKICGEFIVCHLMLPLWLSGE